MSNLCRDPRHDEIEAWYRQAIEAGAGRAVQDGLFRELAEKWRAETGGLSSLQRIVHNRWYQQIIGLGPAAVPLILEDLRDGPGGYWFWALTAITREDPAKGTTRYSDARMAWLDWAATGEPA